MKSSDACSAISSKTTNVAKSSFPLLFLMSRAKFILVFKCSTPNRRLMVWQSTLCKLAQYNGLEDNNNVIDHCLRFSL